MKKLMYLLLAFAFILPTACSSNEEKSSHTAQWSSDGKDSVIKVNYHNEDGTMSNFWMNYLIFRSLFNNGGYSSVNQYYQSHYSEFNNQSQYRSYAPRANTTTTTSAYKPPASTSSGYRSPSSSYTPSKSYSSPVKSYSSPARSYSSPVRSSSSPSRRY